MVWYKLYHPKLGRHGPRLISCPEHKFREINFHRHYNSKWPLNVQDILLFLRKTYSDLFSPYSTNSISEYLKKQYVSTNWFSSYYFLDYSFLWRRFSLWVRHCLRKKNQTYTIYLFFFRFYTSIIHSYTYTFV